MVNSYHALFDNERIEGSIDQIMELFSPDCTMETEMFGSAQNATEVKELLQSTAALGFLDEVRHVVQGHVVKFEEGSTTAATVSSYVTAFWKCTPVTLSQWTDTVKYDGSVWRFHSRTCVDLQKNLELIGEMQLRGKKSYNSD